MPFATEPHTIQSISFAGRSIELRVGPNWKHQRPKLPSLEICTAQEQQAITYAFGATATLTARIFNMGGACETLADAIDHLGINDLEITCDGCKAGQDTWSDATKHAIAICANQTSMYALVRPLLREQILLAGGTPLDKWAVDGWLFAQGMTPGGGVLFTPLGTTPLMEMCAGSSAYASTGANAKLRLGTYVVWDPVSGQLWSRSKGPNLGTAALLVPGSIYWRFSC